MREGWSAEIPGYQTKIVQVGNCTVRIHRPILEAEERSRREEEVKNALRGLMRKEL